MVPEHAVLIIVCLGLIILGILARYLWYLSNQIFPAMETNHREDLKQARLDFLDALKEGREQFVSVLQSERLNFNLTMEKFYSLLNREKEDRQASRDWEEDE